MSISKQEFMQQAANAMGNYPTAATYYNAQDPRMLGMLEAMATMLALKSAEQDVSYMEPFSKARDVTVLADAAVKGLLPFGTPMEVALTVANGGTAEVVIANGRGLYDATGRHYVVLTGATVAAGETGAITAKQVNRVDISHIVAVSDAFYRIAVEKPAVGHLSAVRVQLGSTVFRYTEDFVNIAAGDTVYHMEVDENQVLSIVFGADGIAGYQPSVGEAFTVTTDITDGYVELDMGAPFSFEYTSTAAERSTKLTLAAVNVQGNDPMNIATMRNVCRFPSIYDSSAVYLANFDWLIRRNLGSGLKFLSVWNEHDEEKVRGANVDNINRLFVAVLSDTIATDTLHEKITSLISVADDSYRLKFVDAQVIEIPVTVSATIPSTFDNAATKSKIEDVILENYGVASDYAARGNTKIRVKDVYKQLRENITALADAEADYTVTINQNSSFLPEQFRYVSVASLAVEVDS